VTDTSAAPAVASNSGAPGVVCRPAWRGEYRPAADPGVGRAVQRHLARAPGGDDPDRNAVREAEQELAGAAGKQKLDRAARPRQRQVHDVRARRDSDPGHPTAAQVRGGPLGAAREVKPPGHRRVQGDRDRGRPVARGKKNQFIFPRTFPAVSRGHRYFRPRRVARHAGSQQPPARPAEVRDLDVEQGSAAADFQGGARVTIGGQGHNLLRRM